MEQQNIPAIPAEKFRMVQADAKIHDVKFETKPVGFLKDSFRRFCKNKSSVVAAIIIILLILFAFVGPLISAYKMDECYGVYAKCRPVARGLSLKGFWDGGYTKKLNDRFYVYMAGIGIGAEFTEGGKASFDQGTNSEYAALISVGDEYTAEGSTYRDARVDSYKEVGFYYLSVTQDQIDKIKAWEAESGLKVIYPMVDTENGFCDFYNKDNANFWYKHDSASRPVDDEGNRLSLKKVQSSGLVDNYLRDEAGNPVYQRNLDGSMCQIRVLYYNYYQYISGTTPNYLFGVDSAGYDIVIRISSGLKLSFLLAICVSAITIVVGTVYGAVEGYYGGLVDLIGERISDVLNGIPFIVSCVLIKLHFINTGKMTAFTGLLFAYLLTGWIGQAYLTRTQFYRFKNQEYILAARTLGAKDGRLMFRHILPNAIGTIVTSCALSIPSVILSESTLSFLGIYNFNSRTMTSLGTMLGNGQAYLSTYPHILFFPALAISLLMISFNLFGNGLRDAFNPTLRGAHD